MSILYDLRLSEFFSSVKDLFSEVKLKRGWADSCKIRIRAIS